MCTLLFVSGITDDQWDIQDVFVNILCESGLSNHPMMAHKITVIGRIDNDGFLRYAGFIQCLKYFPNTMVDLCHQCVIGANIVAPELLVRVGLINIPQFTFAIPDG